MGTFVGAGTGSANSTSTTVPWPAGVASGDLAVLVVTGSTSGTHITPTGFTLINVVDDDSARNALFVRVCDGSETGNLTVDYTVTTKLTIVLSVVRGYTGIDVHASFQETVGQTTHDCPQVTPTVADAGILVTTCERVSGGSLSATPPTGYTLRGQIGETGGGSSFTALADDGLAVSRSAGVPVDPASWTHTVSDDTSVTRTIALAPAASGQSQAISPAVEVDVAATVIAEGQSQAILPAVEVDVAAGKLGMGRSLNPAAETDTAQPVAGAKSRTILPAAETDVAVPVAAPAGGPVPPAVETDTAVAVSGVKTRAILPATDTGTAVALAGAKTGAVAPAVEAGSAVALTGVKTLAVSPAAETDTAGALAGAKTGTITPAAETDVAVAVSGGAAGGPVGDHTTRGTVDLDPPEGSATLTPVEGSATLTPVAGSATLAPATGSATLA